MNIAIIETIKLSDNSKVYNVLIHNGRRIVARLNTISLDAAQTICDAINNGVNGIE